MIGAVSVFYPVVVACNILVQSCFMVIDPDGPYTDWVACRKSLPGMVQFSLNATPGGISDYEYMLCCSSTLPDEDLVDGNITCVTAPEDDLS